MVFLAWFIFTGLACLFAIKCAMRMERKSGCSACCGHCKK